LENEKRPLAAALFEVYFGFYFYFIKPKKFKCIREEFSCLLE